MNNFFRLLVSTLVLASYTVVGIAAEGPGRLDGIKAEFELSNAAGERVTEKDFRGHYVLLAFGFTHCLHVCPLVAANMALALKIGLPGAQGVFISVDSERDSPAITQDYASAYSTSMQGLGGTYAQISSAARNFNVSFVVTKSQKSYTVQHTSDTFLIGPDGQVLDAFVLNTPPKTMAAAMRQALH